MRKPTKPTKATTNATTMLVGSAQQMRGLSDVCADATESLAIDLRVWEPKHRPAMKARIVSVMASLQALHVAMEQHDHSIEGMRYEDDSNAREHSRLIR